MKRLIAPLLCLAVLALTPAAQARETCGVPGENTPTADVAGWMALGANAAGLPGELPVMASLVESGLTNLSPGDGDAAGYFAMRVSIWNTGPYAGFPDDPALQLQWFIDQALAVKRQRIAAGDAEFGRDPSQWGDWVADVMRPAEQFRGRYQLRLDEARELIAQGCAARNDPPVVTLSVAPQAPPGQGGWLNAADGPARVRVSATDDTAVNHLACTDNGAAVVVAGQAGSNPRTGAFIIAADGTHAIACTAIDAAGLASAAATATVKLDRTAAAITLLVNSHLSLRTALRHGIPATIGCSEACTYRTSVEFAPRTAKALHIAPRDTISKHTITLKASGRRTITIKLTGKARGALHHTAGVKLIVRATATDRAGNTGPARVRRTTLRRR